jgi:hypothetical protein
MSEEAEWSELILLYPLQSWKDWKYNTTELMPVTGDPGRLVDFLNEAMDTQS